MYCIFVKTDLTQCRRLHIIGEKFCPYHIKAGTSKGSGKRKNPFEHDSSGIEIAIADIPVDQMKLYGKRIGPKLKELLQESLNNSKAHDISEEIALTRQCAGEAVSAYSTLIDMEGLVDETKRKMALHEAASVVMGQMDSVAKLVERAAKIHALTVDKLPPNAIDDCIRQICRFVYQVFGEQKEKIEEFDRLLTDEMQLPSLKQLGTTIMPRDQVIAMDSTIPVYYDDVEDDTVNEDVEE